MNSELKEVVKAWAIGVFSLLMMFAFAWALRDAMIQGVIDLNNPGDAAAFIGIVICLFGLLFIAMEIHVRIVLWAIEKHREVKA